MGDVASITIKPEPTGPDAPKPDAQPDPQRPAWLPEKFKTPEDLAKSYTELEKKLGSQGQQQKAPEAKAPADPKTPEVPPQVTGDEKQAEEAVAKAGLDMKALTAEFMEKGDISPEAYKKLEDVGISKDQVETFKAGMKAKTVEFENKILAGVDRSDFQKAADWADQNWPKEDAEAFNQIMQSGDPVAGKLAVKGLLADFKKSLGPQRIEGGKVTEDFPGYRSRAEQLRDMGDPKYKTDPAFREMVMNKTAKARF
jgi:hypothetical protein